MGEDGFSAAIRRDLEADGVITALIQTDASYPTPLSVVIGNPILGVKDYLNPTPSPHWRLSNSPTWPGVDSSPGRRPVHPGPSALPSHLANARLNFTGVYRFRRTDAGVRAAGGVSSP